MTFRLTVIGSGSGAPLPGRFTSAQVLNVHERFVLIDCGEGTQINLRRFGVNFNRIDVVLISHLHGDHYLGLPGLLNTFHLLGRTRDLHIAGHRKLKDLLDYIFNMAGFDPSYPIHFHEIKENEAQLAFENEHFSIQYFPLKHRIVASGFRISEKTGRNRIRKSFIEKYHPDIHEVRKIMSGCEYVDKHGVVIDPSEIFQEAPPPRTYAYVSDTIFDPDICIYVNDVDLLYHEATYDASLTTQANDKMHSTATAAAKIALQASAKQLLIGHFSSRYRTPDLLLREAQSIFPDTIAASDGQTISIERRSF